MVFVLDKRKKPLMPCTEKRARLLLERGRAVVHRMSPFTIRLKDRTAEESRFQPLRLKLDPGSRTTGFAVLREDTPNRSEVILLGKSTTSRVSKIGWTPGGASVAAGGTGKRVTGNLVSTTGTRRSAQPAVKMRGTAAGTAVRVRRQRTLLATVTGKNGWYHR
ncbi:RRXRR protein [Desulfofundulus australicus DSM 11792]|uniref:RRXRR protein n=1 Tax=Desulfofundulus australicus DSM 11792 TaxID=1121425 RepID=A0A1M5DHC0_9FIRM|nr:RRXRR protein [Desulfofundulus australicus DSM 11792]